MYVLARGININTAFFDLLEYRLYYLRYQDKYVSLERFKI